MNPNDILQEFRRLVDLAEIEISRLLPDSGFKSSYPEKLIGKNAMPGPVFELWFKKRLAEDAVLQQRWLEYESWYRRFLIAFTVMFD